MTASSSIWEGPSNGKVPVMLLGNVCCDAGGEVALCADGGVFENGY